MDDLIFRMFSQEGAECSPIAQVIDERVRGDAVYLPTHADDLLIIIAWLLSIDEEVELYFRSVHMAVKVHYECFGPRSIHGTNDVEHSDQYAHRLSDSHFSF